MTIFDFSSTLLILVNLFIFILFLLLVFMVFKLYLTRVRQEEEMLDHKVYQLALKKLEDANMESIRIIEESTKKAHDVLSNAEFLTEESREFLKTEIHKLSQEQLQNLQSTSDSMLTNYVHALEDESQEGLKTVKSFAEALEEETKVRLDEFKRKYEEEQMAKLQSHLNEFLITVSKDVLGKSIDLELHQNLVIESLERFKKELS